MAARSADTRETPPEQISGCAHPKTANAVLGHDAQCLQFCRALESGRLHHAWLLEGQKGIGKSTFAWNAAKRLLDVPSVAGANCLDHDANSHINHQIIAGGHGDILPLAREWDEKGKKWSSAISVEQARSVGNFFGKKAAGGGYRVCIIDAVDEMTNNAMNALLKTLEEPPAKGILFLVCHQPGKLPETIRSRCRRVLFQSPSPSTALQILHQNAPDKPDQELQSALELAGGAPGLALEILHQDGLALWRDIQSLLQELPRSGPHAESMMRDMAKADKDQQNLTFKLLIRALETQAGFSARNGEMEKAGQWVTALSHVRKTIMELRSIHLDPVLCLADIFTRLRQIRPNGQTGLAS